LVPGTTLKALVERDDDGCEAGGAGQRWQQRRRNGTTTVEEERDITVLERSGEGRADGGDGMDLAAAMAWRWMEWWWQWRWRRRRGRRKFWQPDGIQVKILRLGFKDRETWGFIGRT
jgi:hypothetical protein